MASFKELKQKLTGKNTQENLPEPKTIEENLNSNLEYEEHGSTPFLGVNGIVMKCHGSSSAKSIKNALISAEKAYHENLIEDIAERISNHLLLKQENV